MANITPITVPFGAAITLYVPMPATFPVAGTNVKFELFAPNPTGQPVPALLTKTVGSGITLDALNNRYVISFAAADLSAALPGVGAGTYSYSVARTDSGAEDLFAYGTFSVYWPRPL